MFSEKGGDAGLKRISSKNDQSVPKLAIVDGEQRLTSLDAVLKGVEVLRADFKRATFIDSYCRVGFIFRTTI